MVGRVLHTIKKLQMLKRGDTVLVAVSGGVDSTVLLHVLNSDAIRKGLNLKLAVFHLDHGLRGEESERDYMFVRDLARGLGLKFIGKRLNPGELAKIRGVSLQEAARTRRYELLGEAARKAGARRIALGHTLDDQAETVLMRLIKGSSLSGLSGIPAVRGPYIRPLIEVPRTEIERYAVDRGIGFVVDSTNLEDRYLRNDVRLNLMPFIGSRYNPGIRETLSRTASVLRADDEYLETVASKALKEAAVKRSGSTVSLDRKRLAALHDAILSRVFLRAMALLGRDVETYSTHVRSFIGMVRAGRPNASVTLPGGLRAVREYDSVRIALVPERKGRGPAGPFDVDIKVPGATRVKGTGITVKTRLMRKRPASLDAGRFVAFFDYGRLEAPLHLRSFVPGDRIVPLGMEGHKKLKEVFIENKVPPESRKRYPLLASGPQILWAVGLKRSDFARVMGRTKRVLRVECTGFEIS